VVAVSDGIAADQPTSLSDLTQADASEAVTEGQDWAAVAGVPNADRARAKTPVSRFGQFPHLWSVPYLESRKQRKNSL
jgi:hypothetical protein